MLSGLRGASLTCFKVPVFRYVEYRLASGCDSLLIIFFIQNRVVQERTNEGTGSAVRRPNAFIFGETLPKLAA